MLTVIKKASRIIIKAERIGHTLVLTSEYAKLKIEPKSASIVRIVYTSEEQFQDRERIVISASASFGDWSYIDSDDSVELTTSKLRVSVSKATASIRYYDSDNRLILSEKEEESRILDRFDSYRSVIDENTVIERIETSDGMKQIMKGTNKVFDKQLYHTRLHLQFQEDEALFGLGQQEEGVLNLRGTTQYLHQANRKIAIPFLISTKGYGLLCAACSPIIFNDTAYGSYLYAEAETEMDHYFIQGNYFDEIIKGYRFLTGRAAMLPKWAFGFIQSMERYESAEELIETVKEFRNRGLGLDTIVLDWMSWTGNLWGQKTLDPERFPDPTAMTKALHDEHVHLMVSIWPNMDESSDNYKEFLEQKLLLPAINIYDAFEPKARQLYWKQVEEGLYSKGVDAWWCDASEPFTPEFVQHEKPEPSRMYQEFCEESSKYLQTEYGNIYGLMHSQAIYEGQRSVSSEKRVVNLTRSGYTGQQKYGVILWSGDIEARWDTLKKQIAAGLNFCASGMPYWTLDIGAFFVKQGIQWFWNGQYEDGCNDLGYRELYTRWYQYGAFLPVFRSHGTDTRREQWYYGEECSMFYEALTKANQLRYQLMPYIYSCAGSVWREDATLLRMLAFNFMADVHAVSIKDQFMFGPCLMICPVTEPMYYKAGSNPIENSSKTRKVYLPTGTDWYDFHTNERYSGGQEIMAAADINSIPIYVKAGSIIPVTQAMQYVDEACSTLIEVLVFAGSNCKFSLYEDSGDGYQYEDGAYSLTDMTWDDQTQKMTIAEPAGQFTGMHKERKFTISVIN